MNRPIAQYPVFYVLLLMSLAILPTLLKADRLNSSNEGWLKYEIRLGGSALFYDLAQSKRRPLWIVDCAPPDLQCVARTEGLALRLDENRRPWLIGMASRAARISIQESNFLLDAPRLFVQPLTSEAIKSLSQKRSFLIIEEKGQSVWRVRTAGIDRVLEYLRWVDDISNRVQPKAHLRRRGEDGDLPESPSQIEKQHQLSRPIPPKEVKKFVPNDKPQSEFAIQSQGGHSFFSPSGRAGY